MGLECLLNVVRALGMGSCLSGEGGTAHHHYHPPYALASSSPPTSPSSPSRKKQFNRNDSSKVEMKLHRVPGRFFLNASTDTASLFSKQGKKGINQDAMIVWEVSCYSFNFVLFLFWVFSFLLINCSNSL